MVLGRRGTDLRSSRRGRIGLGSWISRVRWLRSALRRQGSRRSGPIWLGAYLFGAAVGGLGLGRVLVPSPEPAPLTSAPHPAPAPVADVAPVPSGVLAVARDAFPYVSGWHSDLTRVPRRLLDAYLAKPEPWRAELIPILASFDVPPEFLYLALLESGMDPAAESPAAAVGLWQFTAPTARYYGLIVGEDLDERLDWRRSTFAAGRYLSELYDLFGTWELAAAAYNAGPGRVSRAISETGLDSYWKLVEAGRLPQETRDYVPKFLAIVQLAAERRAGPGGELRPWQAELVRWQGRAATDGAIVSE